MHTHSACKREALDCFPEGNHDCHPLGDHCKLSPNKPVVFIILLAGAKMTMVTLCLCPFSLA